MELKRKRFNFLGDSITYGFGTSDESKRYTNLIAQKTGAICNNYGVNGTKVAKTTVLDPNLYKRIDFCGRVKTMHCMAKYVVVFGGTNDFGHDNPVGTMKDRSPYTFYGALHKIYNDYRKYVPLAEMIFITPLHRESELTKKVNGAGNSLEDYVNAVKEVAKFYGCPVLDLYNWDGFDLRKPEDREAYGPDGLHPNDAGHEVLANAMIEFFESL